MNHTFIYALHDPRNWEIRYVGKADDPHRRLRAHALDRNRLGIRSLIEQLKVLGLSLQLSILQRCDKSTWQFWEKFWIQTARNSGAKLLNIMPGGNQPFLTQEDYMRIGLIQRGRKHSPEHIAKSSAIAMKGKHHSPETRAMMSVSRKGRKLSCPRSLEFRAKISAASKGRRHTFEARAKMSAAHKGIVHSREAIEKVAAALRGKPLTPERRAKISAAHKGKILTSEHREKIRLGSIGKVHCISAEGHAAIIAANKARAKKGKDDYSGHLF